MCDSFRIQAANRKCVYLHELFNFDVAFICNGKYEQKKPVALYKVSKINNWMETWCGFVHLKREAHLKKHYFLFFRPEMHSRVRKLWNCGVLFKLNENDIKKRIPEVTNCVVNHYDLYLCALWNRIETNLPSIFVAVHWIVNAL